MERPLFLPTASKVSQWRVRFLYSHWEKPNSFLALLHPRWSFGSNWADAFLRVKPIWVATMIDESTARLRAHQSNLRRYRRLLQTELSDLERSYIANRVLEEQIALEEISNEARKFSQMPKALHSPQKGFCVGEKRQRADNWRDSPAQLARCDVASSHQMRAHVKSSLWSYDLAVALEKLADRGVIDRMSQDIRIFRRDGATLALKHYRRRTA
jgi:hypothetical protein